VTDDLAARFRILSETISLGDLALEITRPIDAEELIDEEEFAADERLPYWAELWPSGRVLADRLARADLSGMSVLELGAGIAVPAIVAALRGASVIATDWYAPALEFAAVNARRARVTIGTMLVDWRHPPADLIDAAPFDRVIAADVLYEARNAEPLAALIPALVADDGELWIADPRRPDAKPFLDTMAATGWALTTDEIPFEGRLDETGPIVHLHRLRPPRRRVRTPGVRG
jgi:predicted nicotinamide N-methyase